MLQLSQNSIPSYFKSKSLDPTVPITMVESASISSPITPHQRTTFPLRATTTDNSSSTTATLATSAPSPSSVAIHTMSSIHLPAQPPSKPPLDPKSNANPASPTCVTMMNDNPKMPLSSSSSSSSSRLLPTTTNNSSDFSNQKFSSQQQDQEISDRENQTLPSYKMKARSGISKHRVSMEYAMFDVEEQQQQQQQEQEQRYKVTKRIFIPLYVATILLLLLPILPSFLVILLGTVWGILFLVTPVYFLYHYDAMSDIPCVT